MILEYVKGGKMFGDLTENYIQKGSAYLVRNGCRLIKDSQQTYLAKFQYKPISLPHFVPLLVSIQWLFFYHIC